MKNRFGKFNVSKVSWTSCHVASTSLTFRSLVNHSLSGVHEATNFGSPPFHSVGVADTIWGHGHSFLFVVVYVGIVRVCVQE